MLPRVSEINVVVPVYGCGSCLETLHERLVQSLSRTGADWEIIYVDDCSPDESWNRLAGFAASDPRVRAFHMSRNFGQHAAITAGLAQSRGEWTVVMDCDLQDPPEEIPRLYEIARKGHDLVLTTRLRRAQNPFRKLAARVYFKARNFFFKTDIGSEYSTLSILSRKVVNAFLSVGDRDRQYMLILHWLGFRPAVLEIQHSSREAGHSSYTLGTLVRVALDGMFFQTTVLLRWIVYTGFAVAVLGALAAAGIVYSYMVENPLPGWTSLSVLILLIGGFIIISTGISALYVGKIFDQVKGRPLYVIDRVARADGESIVNEEAGTAQVSMS